MRLSCARGHEKQTFLRGRARVASRRMRNSSVCSPGQVWVYQREPGVRDIEDCCVRFLRGRRHRRGGEGLARARSSMGHRARHIRRCSSAPAGVHPRSFGRAGRGDEPPAPRDVRQAATGSLRVSVGPVWDGPALRSEPPSGCVVGPANAHAGRRDSGTRRSSTRSRRLKVLPGTTHRLKSRMALFRACRPPTRR